MLGENANFDVKRFSNERDAEVCQVIDKLATPWKISTQRNFDIGKGISEGDEAVSQKINAQEVGGGKNFGAEGSQEVKGAGETGVTAGMTDVGLVVESRDRVGTEHGQIATES